MYGDSDVIRRRVNRLREQADDIRASADKLVSQAEAVPWHGRAAESLRGRMKERATALRSAAEQHDRAADALAKHLTQVDLLKEQIAEVEARAEALTIDGKLDGFEAPEPGHKDWLEVTLR
jgi:chromosome segregation ATPase